MKGQGKGELPAWGQGLGLSLSLLPSLGAACSEGARDWSSNPGSASACVRGVPPMRPNFPFRNWGLVEVGAMSQGAESATAQ